MGEHRLQAGITQYGGAVDIVYRSFQLRPDLAPETDINFIEMFAQRRGLTYAQTAPMMAGTTAEAAALGLTLNYDKARATNSRRAQELLHFAKARGRQHDMAERLFEAYFANGLLISAPETLAHLASDIGLDRAEAAAAIADGRHGSSVDSDLAAARQIGITSVPYFVIDHSIAISGGQAPGVFAQALSHARATRA
jgi:predicted DsbA family dithiol-disulfide isomerase